MRLHHVQVSCPPGGEDASRSFWTALGLSEVDKPEALAGRGGCWFRAYDAAGAVSAEVHVGVEPGMTPARKAHPALLVDDPSTGSGQGLDVAAAALRAGGHPVDDSERDTFPGFLRLHTTDPHGNRVELLQEHPAES